MTLKHSVVGALAVLFTAGELTAFAAQRNDGQERGGRRAVPRTEQRDSRPNDQRDGNRDNGRRDDRARDGRSSGPRDNRQYDRRNDGRNDGRRNDGRFDNRNDNRWRDNRGPGYSYGVRPRVYTRRAAPRHYFGSGGSFSVYFGLGSGFRYGSPYRGRVYGYVGPVYGGRQLYGDVRLEVRPRNAAVYVDGYYAGVVDNFDGVFQRLTLTVGPHEIEVDAPGLEPRFFDVYVDPVRTIVLNADLFDPRW